MAEFYGSMKGVADKLLGKFKQGVIQLVTVTPGSGPAHNPGPPVRSDPIALDAVANAAYSGTGATKTYQDGTLIEMGDLKVVSNVITGTNPKLTDKIVIDGTEYNIKQFNRVPDPGVTVAWVFFVRR